MQQQNDDLWWKARERTRLMSEPGALESLVKMVSYPGEPTRMALADFAPAREGRGLIIDLNKYRDLADLKAFYEHGVDGVLLRMGGPGAWIYDNWQLQEDATYRKYFEQARALGMVIGGYFVYSAGIDDQNYEASEGNLNFMGEIMAGGYMPDYLAIDDEVNEWWQNGKKVTATPVNQVKGVRILIDKCWKRFKRVTMHYSANWFINQNAEMKAQYTTWLDNVNGSAQGLTVPTWRAWYPITPTTIYTNARDVLGLLPIPSAAQEISLLSNGSFSPHELWQFTSNLVTPYCQNTVTKLPIGVDANITRRRLDEYYKDVLGVAPVVTPPPGGGGTPPPAETDLGEVLGALAEMDDKLEAILAKINQVFR